jgi:hypothetical protein
MLCHLVASDCHSRTSQLRFQQKFTNITRRIRTASCLCLQLANAYAKAMAHLEARTNLRLIVYKVIYTCLYRYVAVCNSSCWLWYLPSSVISLLSSSAHETDLALRSGDHDCLGRERSSSRGPFVWRFRQLPANVCPVWYPSLVSLHPCGSASSAHKLAVIVF